jgi:pantetheine-phosphate adenylyltransferase
MRTTAIYPGSFDPVTNGHLDVMMRAARLFDRLIVAVAHNEQKSATFSVAERLALLRTSLREYPNIEVMTFDGLLVDFARQTGAGVLIRGLRAVSDFELEFQMALMNRKLHPELETLFLTPKEEFTYLSSRLVKEVARLQGEIASFVPPAAAIALRARFSPAQT